MTDLPTIYTYEDVARWWEERAAQARAEGLAQVEQSIRRDQIPDGVADYIRAECERAIDEKIREGREMIARRRPHPSLQ